MNQIEGKPSQNVPLPDCPTPDSIHSCTESVSSATFPATSPVSQNETDFNSYLQASSNSSSETYQQCSNGQEISQKYQLNSPEKCQNDKVNYIASSRQFPSPYFSSDITNNSSISDECFKTTSSKSKGKSNILIYFYRSCPIMRLDNIILSSHVNIIFV